MHATCPANHDNRTTSDQLCGILFFFLLLLPTPLFLLLLMYHGQEKKKFHAFQRKRLNGSLIIMTFSEKVEL